MRYGSCLEHGEAHEHEHERLTRRDFLVRSGLAAAGFSFLLGTRPMTAFGQIPMLARHLARQTDRVLVLVQLAGGNDGLNTVVPYANDIYYQKRPTIAVAPGQVIPLDGEVGLHPAMSALRPLWDDARLAVVHNVGYPDQSRSHFRGTDIWATGSDATEQTGWAGRYLADAFPDWIEHPPEYPLAVRVGGATATLFQSPMGNLSMTFSDAGQFARFVQQGGFYSLDGLPSLPYGDAMRYVRSVANASYRYVEAVQTASEGVANEGPYPTDGFSDNLAVVARLIRGRLGARVYTVSLGGFDTHAGQGGAEGGHARLLARLADGLAAFHADLRADGLDRDVLVLTFSEFGRTLRENGSGGTDHGAGAPLFVLGSGLHGGLYGAPSPLTPEALYGGDPRFSTDFRSVYASVLDGWFGMEAAETDALLGGTFARLDLVGAATSAAPASVPGALRLAAHPNPVTTVARLQASLPAPGRVRLAVYDAAGRRVALVFDGFSADTRVEAAWNASALPAGLYFARLETDHGTRTQALTILP